MHYCRLKNLLLIVDVIALAIASVVLPANAQSSNPEGGYTGDTKVSVEISDMEVAEAMQILSDATGLNILVGADISGKITAFVLEMNPEQALKETIEVNGFHYVKNGDVVWVLSDEDYYEDLNLGRERRIVLMEHASVQSVVMTITDALSQNARVTASPESNVIIVSEEKERIEAAVKLIKDLDVPPETQVFQLQHAAAADMLLVLQALSPNPNSLRADVRTNQIMISGPVATLDRLGKLLHEFDKPDKISTRVFNLKFANADATAQLLEEVLTGRKQSSSGSSSAYGSSSQGQQSQPSVFTTEPSRPSSARPRESWRQYRSSATPKLSSTKTTTPSTPTAPAAPTGPQVTSGEGIALGPLANVTADSRTNSVIVTHVESVLERIEQIIDSIDVPGQYHTYQFENINPAELELESKLAGLLPLEDPYFQIDPISRKASFRASEEHAEEIFKLFKEWDGNVRQVVIEAEILRVNVTFLKKLGIQWQAIIDESTRIGHLNKLDVGAGFPAQLSNDSPQGRLTIGNLEHDDYTVILQALAEDNDTEVISSPRILARDNNEALFMTSRDEPYTVVTVDGNTQTTLQDVRFLNVGVTLAVLPKIHKDNVITVDTQLEISSLVEIREGIPVVDRATAQTSINVKDGGVAVIGGLRQRSRSDHVQRVPVLSKIPGIGALFRNKRKQKEEREIILILRPHILGEDQGPTSPMPEVHDKALEALSERQLGRK
jgi:type II secretory pathway component GspD/PulD (secretin)